METPISQSALHTHMDSKFVFHDNVTEILTLGYNTGKNVFLYGRGGHAKSEMTEHFLKFIDPDGSKSFVQSCGEGLTEEKLFGGINLKKLEESGEIEYLVENSFMNKEFVVFEELLDSRINVLLSLKDILTSGRFRQGSQVFDIKTKMVIVLTNRTKQEVTEDNSIKALMERFPLEQKVEWDSYDAESYCEMFMKVKNDSGSEISAIAEKLSTTSSWISPRTAIHLYDCHKEMGKKAYKFFGIDESLIGSVEEKAQQVENTARARIKFSVVRNEINKVKSKFEEYVPKDGGTLNIKGKESELKSLLTKARYIRDTEIKSVSVTHENESDVTSITKEVTDLAIDIKNTIIDSIDEA